MENGTPNGETAVQQPLENNTNPSTTPPQVNVDENSEALRKEAEQAKMRANQLENELKKLRDAQEAAQQEKLKEKEEFKTLYEKTNEELVRLKEEAERKEFSQLVETEKSKVLAEFPESVREIAIEAGISLESTDEDAIDGFKAKLEKIGEKLGATAKVTPNNNRQTSQERSRAELLNEFRETGDPKAIDAAIGELPFIKQFRESQQG